MNVEIPEPIRKELAAVAARMGKPERECVLEALRAWLRSHPGATPRREPIENVLADLQAHPGRLTADEIRGRVEAERDSWER